VEALKYLKEQNLITQVTSRAWKWTFKDKAFSDKAACTKCRKTLSAWGIQESNDTIALTSDDPGYDPGVCAEWEALANLVHCVKETAKNTTTMTSPEASPLTGFNKTTLSTEDVQPLMQ